MKRHFFVGALSLFLSVSAAAQTRAVPVKDFDVFVDEPTGFVFIRLPTGWKFVTRLGHLDLAQLPRNVHRTLLMPESEDAREIAAKPSEPRTSP